MPPITPKSTKTKNTLVATKTIKTTASKSKRHRKQETKCEAYKLRADELVTIACNDVKLTKSLASMEKAECVLILLACPEMSKNIWETNQWSIIMQTVTRFDWTPRIQSAIEKYYLNVSCLSQLLHRNRKIKIDRGWINANESRMFLFQSGNYTNEDQSNENDSIQKTYEDFDDLHTTLSYYVYTRPEPTIYKALVRRQIFK